MGWELVPNKSQLEAFIGPFTLNDVEPELVELETIVAVEYKG